ncbi:MAG: SusC/RagA family TonB-linked outer membrane protein [Bacteroidales bacterium]|nr:SusC/RagA family TonB-linked outer membrane protein [Bacteroidales bacterium]
MNKTKTLSVKILSLLALMLFLMPQAGSVSFAQDKKAKIVRTLVGTVNAGGAFPGPLPGASVYNTKTRQGVITDADGNYSIGITGPEDILQFRFLGYKDLDKIAGVGDRLDVELEDAADMLEETVVIGYGTTKKRDITGSIVSVTKDDIENKMPTNIFDVLQGTAAGVQVTSGSGQPGEGSNVIIRGTSTMNDAGVGPLWVVDGVPCNDIDQINPYDIESVEVLKDAASAAIYGARSANGVILVTTKRGNESNPVLEVRYQHSFANLTHKLPQINANQYREMQHQYMQYALDEGAGLVSQAVINILNSQLGDPYNALLNNDNDYQDIAYRLANKDQVDLSFGGASRQLKYMLMGGFYNEQGIIKNTNFRRASVRLNADYTANEILSVGTKINVSYAKKDGVDEAGYLNSILSRKPTLSLYYPDGTLIGTLWGISPLSADLQTNFNEYYRASVFQYADINFNEHLKWTSNLNANFGLVRYTYMRPTALSDQYLHNNGQHRSTMTFDVMNENYLNYSNTFGDDHTISAMAGFSLQSWHSAVEYFKGKDSATDAVWTMNAFAANFDLTSTGSTETKHTMASAFARFTYNYKSKYIFSANMRADGSSRFASNKKVGLFPSVSAAWRFSDERFMRRIKKAIKLTDAKLRVSYGVTGNEAIGDFDSQLSYAIGGIYDGVAGVTPSRIAVNDLGWERTRQLNIGTDLTFLQGRYQLTLDWFDKVTDNLLANYEIPKEWGFNTVRKNIGSIDNKGVELAFKGTFINKKNYYLHFDANLTYSRNTVLELANHANYIYSDNWYISEKRPLGDFYGYKYLGVFAYDESNAFTNDWKQLTPVFDGGIFSHYTLDGVRYDGPVNQKTLPSGVPFRGGDINWDEDPEHRDGIINDQDRMILGNAQPFLTGGLNMTFRYKQITLTAASYFSFGGQIYNFARYNQDQASMAAWSTTPTINWINNFWVKQGDQVEYPRPFADSFQNDRHVNSKYIEDGSYIKIKNIRIAYRLKQNVTQKLNIKGLNIYAYVTNPFTFTAYSGYDPEFSNYSALSIGMDTNRFPRNREFGLGLTLNL